MNTDYEGLTAYFSLPPDTFSFCPNRIKYNEKGNLKIE
jgi:hypothetical protein